MIKYLKFEEISFFIFSVHLSVSKAVVVDVVHTIIVYYALIIILLI